LTFSSLKAVLSVLLLIARAAQPLSFADSLHRYQSMRFLKLLIQFFKVCDPVILCYWWLINWSH